MSRDRARPAGLARERTLRRRLQAVLLSVALLPAGAIAATALLEHLAAGAAPAARPPYLTLAVTALAAACASAAAVVLSRRLARRIVRGEEQEARFRSAFAGASLASSLAEGAWLARLQELQQRVDDRTEAYQSENAELEAFTYAVSHDLRAPLRHLDAFATLLRERTAGRLDARSEHYVDALAQAARRLGALVDDLLSFLQLRRAALLRSPVEVGAVVRELIGELAPQTAGRDVRWTVGELPQVDADPRLLRVALANLLSNAVKFTRSRPSAEIEVGGSAPAGGPDVVLFVRDNGVGFDARYAGKLFRVFHRLQRPEEVEGTGIGLAMVRRIVERHGGQVWADSEPGQGATFYLSLPREAGDAAPPRARLDALGTGAAPAEDRQLS